jgi:hypothetical protein
MPGVNPEVRCADTGRVKFPGSSRQHSDIGPTPRALGRGLMGVTPDGTPSILSAQPAWAAATPMVYVDCDIPDGMTLAEWRRRRHERGAPRRSSRWTVRGLARRLAR